MPDRTQTLKTKLRSALSQPEQQGDERLQEAESIICECNSPDGFCGEMPDELRDRIEDFCGRPG